MYKIVYVVSTLKLSGPTNQLFNIVVNLDSTRFDAHIITLSPEPEESRWNDFMSAGVKVYSLGLSRLSGLILARAKLRRLISEIKPDLIHTQGLRGDVLSAGLGSIAPRVCTVRNIPQQDYAMTYGKVAGRLMSHNHVKAMRELDMCVGVSEAVSANLQDKFGLVNVATIQNGVDTGVYDMPSVTDKRHLRERLGLPLEGRIWISSGHLSSRKDPLFLIQAWMRWFRETGDHLLFIGTGPLERDCREMSGEAGNIHIAGRVQNVSEYLKASDYFISASKAEGLPNAVLEALACGLPVLLSDIGPHRELWEMSPEVGNLFALDDEVQLLKGLDAIRGSDAQKLAAAAHALAHEQLSARAMSRKYQQTYLGLMAGVHK